MRSIFFAALVAFTGLSAAAPAYHQYKPPQHYHYPPGYKRDHLPEPHNAKRAYLPEGTVVPYIIPKREPALPYVTALYVPKRDYVPSEKRAPRYHHAPKYNKVKRQDVAAVPAVADGVVPSSTVPNTSGLVPDTGAVGGI